MIIAIEVDRESRKKLAEFFSSEKVLKLSITATDTGIDVRSEGGLSIQFTPLGPPVATRRSKPRVAQSVFLPIPDHKKVLDCWNTEGLVSTANRAAIDRRRNLPVPAEDLVEVESLLTRVLKKLSVDEVIERLKRYFECCKAGGHIWDGSNHAYKHLGGFLSKLLTSRGSGPAWWEKDSYSSVEDPDPVLTEIVSDIYARAFLGRNRHPELVNPSAEYDAFFRVADRIRKMVGEGELLDGFGGEGKEDERIARYLIRAIRDKTREGTTVAPDELLRRSHWENTLVQFLRNNLGAPAQIIEKIIDRVEVVVGRS